MMWRFEHTRHTTVASLEQDVLTEVELGTTCAGLLQLLDEADDDDALVLNFGSRRFKAIAEGSGTRSLIAELVDRLLQRPMPVVGSFDSQAVNAGMELMLASDIAVAHEDAEFGFTGLAQGAFPACGSIQRLVRAGGRSLAVRIFVLNELLTLRTDIALSAVLIPADGMVASDRAAVVAGTLGHSAPLALQSIKVALRAAQDLPLSGGLMVEADLACLLLPTDDRAEGLAAMATKRIPRFVGR